MIAFAIGSVIGVIAMVWQAAQRRWQTAILVGLGATAITVAYWLASYPGPHLRLEEFATAVTQLLVALFLPGLAGGFVASRLASRFRLSVGLVVAALLWLPILIPAQFLVGCMLNPKCLP